MKKLLSVLFLLSFTLAAVYAQNIQIKGTVVSGTDNEPLPGVNVVVKGNTSTGTITDFNGTFTLSRRRYSFHLLYRIQVTGNCGKRA